MYLGHKRFILFLFYCFSFFVFKAQTLYWVGGSGNFNDQNHWSLTSGGPGSHIVPSANSNIVFESVFTNSTIAVTIPMHVNVNSLEIKSGQKIIFIKGAPSARFTIRSNFENDIDNPNFSSEVPFEFRNTATIETGYISSGDQFLNADFFITAGKWKINKVKLSNKNLFSIENSTVEFKSSFLQAGNFKAASSAVIEFDKAVLKVYNDFSFNHLTTYSVYKSYLTTKTINGVALDDDKSGISNKFTSTNSIMSPCLVISSIVKPSCVPGCDGSFVITIPSPTAACYPTTPVPPFNIQITNHPSCNPIAGLTNVGPGTYTITNACGCNFAYGILLFDQNGFIESDAVSITPPVVSPITISSASINCNGACTGSIATAFTGGTSPYNFTVTPPTGPTTFSTSAGGLNVTNMCAGILNVVAQDSKGCSANFTFSVNQPNPLNPQGSTTSVTCNGACTGIAAVTPTGGTANYTVTWSTGPSNVLTAGQTSSITGLCASASVITATISDSKGCSYPTFTTIIAQPPALTITPTQTNITCGGLCNGSASVTVTGGVPPYTYSWSPGPNTSTNAINSLCAGTQTVSILDNNLCPISQNYTITSPPPITITPTFTNVSCNALCNATINASASGPAGPFTFTLTSSTITLTSLPPWNNLCAGVYTITAQAPSLCTGSIQVTITQPPALTVTAVSQSITCFGLCNGGATVTPSGGNGAPFSYTWAAVPPTGQGTATISNICIAGVYSVSIKDASLCPITATVSILSPPSVIANITSASVTCNAACNGSINAVPSGPPGPYTISLVTPSSGTLTSSPPYTGLCAGIYTLNIVSPGNCTQSFTINIQQPNPLIPSVSSTSITCFNLCNGTLAGSAAGGTPGYTFVWTTPTGTVAGGALAGQCAGNYNFTVTDANGCTASTTATLVQPTDMTVAINPTNPTCFGGCNGVLSATVTGGTPSYTLTWSNGPTGNPNTGLCAGNYTLTVNDSKGCTKTATAVIVSPTSLTLTPVTASTSCAGSCNGSATITASGGTPPYTYQSGATTNTTGIFSGLCAGSYISNVTDGNGCSQSINFTIVSPIALSAAITGIISSCNACTGASTVQASNGTPGYTYIWTNSLSVSVGTNAAVGSLCPGSYTATVTDSKGCTATATANIVQTVSVTIATSGSTIQCFGATNATATANPLGGTPLYQYTWTPSGQNTQVATGLGAGTYTVLVSDANGCSNTATISFTNPPDIIITPTVVNVNCFGNCNGSINPGVTGGTGPISYTWNPGSINTPSLSALCVGTYTLLIKDANGCTKPPQVFTITSTPSITATFTTTNPSACIVNNGSICATPSGGSGSGYTFTWSPSGGVGANTSCYSLLTAGSYSLIVADGAGCTTTLSALITNPGGPTLTINAQSVTCFGGSTGAATVTATGGGPYTFTWTPAVGFTTIGNTSTASGLNTGTYNISVTNIPTGCITTQSIVIAQPTNSLTITSTVTPAKCFAACNGSINITPSGGTPTYTFSWTGPAGFTANTQNISGLCSGAYTLNITDANSCPRQFTFTVTQPTVLTLTATASNVLCNAACNGTINVTASGGTSPVTFTWLPVGTFTGSTNQNIFNLCPAAYTVNATDLNGCPISTVVTITQPTALSSTLTVVNASCSNSCNATASLSVGGGVPTYSFSWSNGPATTTSLNSLCAGNYTGTVVDANGCISAQAFTITTPSIFNVTLTPTNPLCNAAACNGSISTVLAGAQGVVNFNWIAAGTGQNPTNLCAGNYTLTATDAAGCVATGVTSLINPPALLANVTTTNPACNGNCNGIAISTPANATGVVTYTWAAPTVINTTGTINSLCAGNYSVSIQDANGCQAIQTFTLTNPPVLNVNPSIAPATCGSPNGSITVIATGGTPNYTFQFTTPAVTNTTGVITGLAAGIYTVVVNDANNCTNTLTIPLSNSNGPSSAPITSSSITCFGMCTGAASVNPGFIVGGTPGYNITWVVPPSTSAVNPQINLCAGTYTAQITDANSCLLFNSIIITQPTSITILPSLTFPTCNGICDGSVILGTSGGISPYNYTWTPGTSSTATLTSACAGNYTITISDFNNCPSTQTVNLPGVQNMTATASVTNNLCFGNCIGTASIIAISGSSNLPINYVWSTSQAGPFINNLCNGVYTYTATDNIGCFNSFTTTIVSPAQITSTSSVASPSCNMCNGAGTVTAIGGTAPYTYSWTSGASAPTASNLCAGLYQVLVTDGNLCTQLQNVLISNSNGITGETTNIQNEICAGQCNGAATITAVGGTAPITYNWISPAVSNSVITNLCAGPYFVQMTDAQGCVRTSSISINAATQLTLTPSISQPGCSTSNGTISVAVSGGNGLNPSYSWVPGPNITSTYNNIFAGNYTVTVTDSLGCQKTQVFSISNPGAPVITFTQTNIACFNACTGSITALGTGTSNPVSYLWNTGSTSPSVTGLCKGLTTLTVSSPNGCISVQQFSLTDNPAMMLSLSVIQQPRCHDDCNGAITLIPSGGSLPYTFSWSPAATGNPQFSLCPGPSTAAIVYSATVVDSKGCSITTGTTLINPASIALTPTVTNSSCSSISDGALNVGVAGGTPAYSYTWAGPAAFTATTQNIVNILPGTYSLTLIDLNGCQKDTTLDIVPTISVVAQAGNDVTVCPTPSVVLTGTNSFGAVSYDWYLLPNNTTTVGNTVSFSAPTPTTAPGSYTFELVTTSSVAACADRDTIVVNIFALPFVDAGPTFTIPVFSSVLIGGNPTAVGSFSLSWLPDFNLDDPSIPNPTASNTVNTVYTVTVVDLTTGCSASDTMTVFLYPLIKIPNGFSPNGDTKNEKWIIDYIDQFPDNIVEVYNRWGEQLFFKKGYNGEFDGKFKGKDLPVGTYYYVINLNHPAYTVPYTGPLTIFR